MYVSLRSAAIGAAALLTLAGANQLQAQATRTWVSGVGDDANPCSRTAPCKTFAGALSKTAAHGEIDALDPGGYGAVTITKSITIDGDAGMASILAAGTNGIVVAAGPLDIVNIRNLSINGAGTGIHGIRFLSGLQLNVDHCSIVGFTQNGIDASCSGTGLLTVRDTTISDCKQAGISLKTTVGTLYAVTDNVRVTLCAVGVNARDGSRITVCRSDLSGNQTGLIAQTANSLLPSADLSDTLVAHSLTACQSGPGAAVVRLSHCRILNNTTVGLSSAGGAFFSSGDNVFMGNGSDGTPPALIPMK